MPTLEEYLAMMQPQAPSQKEKMMSMLGALGAGLLSAPNWQKGLAKGGLLAYQNNLGAQDRSSADKMAQFQQYRMAREMADQDAQREAAKEEAAKFQQQVGGVLSNAPRLNAMGPGGPTPANAAATAPPDRVEKLRQVAELMIQRGQVEAAQKLLAEADKIEGTFSVDPKVGLGAGGPQFAQFSNKGRDPRIAQGFTPPPDMKAIPLGDRTELVDMLRAQPGALAAGMSPGDKAQNQLGLANLGLNRAKFGYEQEKDRRDAPNAAPKWDSASGQFVYPPSADAPAGRAVQPQGFQGKSDQNAEKSQKALIAIQEAEGLLDRATGSYIGAGADRVAQAFGSSTEGAQATAKLKVLEASIMMNQPRMEGPQSDRDVAMYRQAAGAIGDPTVPIETRRAALEAIKSLHTKYGTLKGGGRSASGAIGPAVGTVVDGHVFIGGDPNKQENWKKR